MSQHPAAAQRPRVLGRARAALLGGGLAAALSLALCATATAAPVTPGYLSMTSEAGDYIGQGQAWHYATDTGDAFASNGPAPAIRIAVDGANGDWWYLDFAAPNGQRLQPGVYAAATRYPFQAPASPGLSVSGEGRGCNTLTGSFEVHEAQYAPDGTPVRFSARFEQHCEGMAPALIGSVEFGTPLPAPLVIDVAIDPEGTVDRRTAAATVRGTATCSRVAQATVAGTIKQQLKHAPLSSAPFSVTVPCSPAGTAWAVSVKAAVGPSFGPGAASIDVTATAEGVSDAASRVVQLRR